VAVTFEDCRAERLPALQEFFGRMYGLGYVLRVNERQLRWQYGDTPISAITGRENAYHVRLGLVDGEVKGCLGYTPLEISMAGRVVRGAWLANWMVDPDQRQFGLGLQLMRQVMSEFEIALTVGANQLARGLFTRMGWTDFGLLPRYVCVLDAQAAETLAGRGSGIGDRGSGRGQNPIPTPASGYPRSPIPVTIVDRFDDDATELWDRLWGERAAGTRRSAEFLNWRYASHPVFVYRLFEVRDNGRLTGLAVYRVEQVRDMPMMVGRIVEIVAEEAAEAGLLGALLDDARSQGVAVLDFFCASRRLAGTMSRWGFLPGDHEAVAHIPILFQPVDRRRSGITFLAYLRNFPAAGNLDWYVTKGDGDQDRPN
jgi:GNAT superfamily N-acetyltransferase